MRVKRSLAPIEGGLQVETPLFAPVDTNDHPPGVVSPSSYEFLGAEVSPTVEVEGAFTPEETERVAEALRLYGQVRLVITLNAKNSLSFLQKHQLAEEEVEEKINQRRQNKDKEFFTEIRALLLVSLTSLG